MADHDPATCSTCTPLRTEAYDRGRTDAPTIAEYDRPELTDPSASLGPKWWPHPDPSLLEHLTPQPPDRRRDTVTGDG